jgi:DNA-binding NarL/FixJ family response regulator
MVGLRTPLLSLVVVDDQQYQRELAAYMLATSFRVHVADGVANGREVILRERPDVVLLDLKYDVGDGFELMHSIFETGFKPPVLATSAACDPVTVFLVDRIGFKGFLWKQTLSIGHLIGGLSAVHLGEPYFDDRFLQVRAEYRRYRTAFWKVCTPSQFRVLSGLARLLSDEQIAAEQEISVKTLQGMLTELRRKVEVETRIELVELAVKLGFGGIYSYNLSRKDSWIFQAVKLNTFE